MVQDLVLKFQPKNLKAIIKSYEKREFSDFCNRRNFSNYFRKLLPINNVFLKVADRYNNSPVCSLLEIYALQEPACHKL